MGRNCCAINCTRNTISDYISDSGQRIIFHKFPWKDPARLRKWIRAVRRKNFYPTKFTSLCSLHFLESDYTTSVVGENLVLRKEAIPTVFDYPEQSEEGFNFLRLQYSSEEEELDNKDNIKENPLEICEKFLDVEVQTTLTGHILDRTIQELRRDKKCLQQKLMRRNSQLMESREETLRKKQKITPTTSSERKKETLFNKAFEVLRRSKDEYETYGMTIAAKLRKMEPTQRLYCENIINQALYKAALNQLDENTVVSESYQNQIEEIYCE